MVTWGIFRKSISASAVCIDLRFPAKKGKCSLRRPDDFLKVSWRGAFGKFPLEVANQVTGRKIQISGFYVVVMSFRLLRRLKGIQTYGPLLVSDFTDWEGWKDEKLLSEKQLPCLPAFSQSVV